jgi:hypothetical protein
VGSIASLKDMFWDVRFDFFSSLLKFGACLLNQEASITNAAQWIQKIVDNTMQLCNIAALDDSSKFPFWIGMFSKIEKFDC